MRIISIDPGYDRLGVAIIDISNKKPDLIYSKCITTPRNISFEERLHLQIKSIEQIITNYTPKKLVIEKVFTNKNAKTNNLVSQIIGAIKYIAQENQIKIHELTPLQIKSAITGYGMASKNAIQKILPKLIELPDNHTSMIDDEIDAIACGVAFISYNKLHK